MDYYRSQANPDCQSCEGTGQVAYDMDRVLACRCTRPVLVRQEQPTQQKRDESCSASSSPS